MSLFMYQAAYTPEALAAMVKSPQDRIELAAKPVIEAVGGKMLAAGYSFGEFDITVVYEAPSVVNAAALAAAVGAGGAVKSARTTNLLSGAEWIEALTLAGEVAAKYRPAG
jgi:uncharacterized protein with GYD domain